VLAHGAMFSLPSSIVCEKGINRLIGCYGWRKIGWLEHIKTVNKRIYVEISTKPT
jgi:hypothetical protein